MKSCKYGGDHKTFVNMRGITDDTIGKAKITIVKMEGLEVSRPEGLQRRKPPGSVVAMLPGKFATVRKVFYFKVHFS